jgi:4-amino-4-deoxy-L-arabinose transferase-like glycosyltransferase
MASPARVRICSGRKCSPQQPQRLLVIVEHEHAALGGHFGGEAARARAAVEQHLVRTRRPAAPQPKPHHLALAGIIPVFAFDRREVCIFGNFHEAPGKTLFYADALSKVKCMDGAAPFSPHRSRLTLLAVIALLLVHFVLAVGSKLRESTTADELVHLTGGVSYWRNHDYRLHPENGIFPQRWAALPAWLAQAKFPPLAGNDYWRTSNVWDMGYQFFYETGGDHFPWLMAGRAMIALFSVATGALVFFWSRRLFGNAGALVSLVLFTFCPTFLAHGALATSDVCTAFFFLAATGAWWRHLHDGRARIWWLSALTLGLAFVTKYSAVLLLPMMVIMAAIRALAPEPLAFGRRIFSTRAAKFGAAALSAAGHAVVVVLMIWAFYGFRYSAFNPLLPPADHFIRPWAVMEQPGGISVRVIHTLANLHALPEGFLYGFVYVLKTVAMRAAFLNGDYSVTGWPTFFLWAFLLKTTVPLLLICALVTGVATRRCLGGGRRGAGTSIAPHRSSRCSPSTGSPP